MEKIKKKILLNLGMGIFLNLLIILWWIVIPRSYIQFLPIPLFISVFLGFLAGIIGAIIIKQERKGIWICILVNMFVLSVLTQIICSYLDKIQFGNIR